MGLLTGTGSVFTSRKIDSPEVWRWRQKLNSHPLPMTAGVTDKHDSAFQFFLRDGIFQDNHLAVIHFIVEVQQSAMRVYHDCLAYLAKLLSIVAAAVCFQAHLVEDALAPA